MDPKNIFSSVSESISGLFRKGKSGAPPSRLIVPERVPYGPFRFKVQLLRGSAYEVQCSTDLENWRTIAAGKAGSEEVPYSDPEASRSNHRFYRVLSENTLSANAVGYVTVNAPPGYSMIANPLLANSNTVSVLLPGMPDGTTLNKFDNGLFKLTENAVNSGLWTNPGETLSPGEGAIFFNPTPDNRSINFAGEITPGNRTLPVSAGFSIRSSQIPKAGRLHTDLGFPVRSGDVVHLFDRVKQNYEIYEYDAKRWEANPPVLGVGESFWIGKNSADNWVQNFSLRQ